MFYGLKGLLSVMDKNRILMHLTQGMCKNDATENRWHFFLMISDFRCLQYFLELRYISQMALIMAH